MDKFLSRIFIQTASEFLGDEVQTIIYDDDKLVREINRFLPAKTKWDGKSVKILGTKINMVVGDIDKLESLLQEYVSKTIGFKFNYEPFAEEVKSSCLSILYSVNLNFYGDILAQFPKIIDNHQKVLDQNPLTCLAIDAFKKMYSPFDLVTQIYLVGNDICISLPKRKNKTNVLPVFIYDIDKFESLLLQLIDTIKDSNTLFKNYFGMDELSKEEQIVCTFVDVFRNVSYMDSNSLNEYVRKYTSFISDDTFDFFSTAKKIGKVLKYDLYAMRKKSDSHFETPYVFCFILFNGKDHFELPKIRFGIEMENGVKTAHILAIQAGKDNLDSPEYMQIYKTFKEQLKATSKYRFYNPSFVVVQSLFFELLKHFGIDKVHYTTSFPFRFHRKIMDEGLDIQELGEKQQNIIVRYTNNLMRTLENMSEYSMKNFKYYPNEHFLSIEQLEIKNQFLKEISTFDYSEFPVDYKLKK